MGLRGREDDLALFELGVEQENLEQSKTMFIMVWPGRKVPRVQGISFLAGRHLPWVTDYVASGCSMCWQVYALCSVFH